MRRGCATLEALRSAVNSGSVSNGSENQGTAKATYAHPRWIRINTLRTSLDEQLRSTFADYERTEVLAGITNSQSKNRVVYIDTNIPDLIAIPAYIDLKSIGAYSEGKLILQDKASCFPAYLLSPSYEDGDVIDACAAPGNKTTHLAALLSKADSKNGNVAVKHRIIACEKDSRRSKTLTDMVKLAGANEIVRIRTNQDFLKMDPNVKAFSKVTALLLDPSCSGSGIVGRDDANVNIHLPNAAQAEPSPIKSKKRKRGGSKAYSAAPAEFSTPEMPPEELPADFVEEGSKLQARLSALSAFQLRLLEHAMAFPAAERITYSTCSIHSEEDEHVVVKALMSEVAVGRGWRITKRGERSDGLQKWHRRGDLKTVAEFINDNDGYGNGLDADVVADACIRCAKGSEDGTMGFFVAGFVRDSEAVKDSIRNGLNGIAVAESEGEGEDESAAEEWHGFNDEDT